MGHPKKQRKKYTRPKRPFDEARAREEKKMLIEYGLRRKREIWRSESILRKFRRGARLCRDKEREKELLAHANRIGLVNEKAKLDDILSLRVEDVLERRLQTIVFKKGLTNTIKQARQAIVHGHIKVGDRVVRRPSFIVPRSLENEIVVMRKNA